MEMLGGEQGDVLLTRHGRRHETAMLAWPNGPWEAATTNPELEEGVHPVSDGDKVELAVLMRAFCPMTPVG